jgi:hypothetical protein
MLISSKKYNKYSYKLKSYNENNNAYYLKVVYQTISSQLTYSEALYPSIPTSQKSYPSDGLRPSHFLKCKTLPAHVSQTLFTTKKVSITHTVQKISQTRVGGWDNSHVSFPNPAW